MAWVAVIPGGAAMEKPSNKDCASYEELLNKLRSFSSSILHVVFVTMGNDIYSNTASLQSPVIVACQEFAQQVSTSYTSVLGVVGASSEIWGYVEKFGWEWAGEFDRSCGELRAIFENFGVRTCSVKEQ